MTDPMTLAVATDQFLCSLKQTHHSAHTVRSYATTLAKLVAHAPAPLADLSVTRVEQFLTTQTHLSAATQARQQAALNSFCTWAVKHALLPTNPMSTIDRVQLDEPAPRGLRREQIEAIWAVIPRQHLRDRLVFRLIYETGVRVGEALALHVEDLDLTRDDEHIPVVGKGNRRRTVLLDDPKLVPLLRHYLTQTGYRHHYTLLSLPVLSSPPALALGAGFALLHHPRQGAATTTPLVHSSTWWRWCVRCCFHPPPRRRDGVVGGRPGAGRSGTFSRKCQDSTVATTPDRSDVDFPRSGSLGTESQKLASFLTLVSRN